MGGDGRPAAQNAGLCVSLWVRVPLVRFCACAIIPVLCLQIFHLGIMGNFQNSRKNSVQGIVLRTINLNLHDYFPPLIRQSIYIILSGLPMCCQTPRIFCLTTFPPIKESHLSGDPDIKGHPSLSQAI